MKKMTPTREVRVFKTADEIGREAIDSIAADGFFTYSWFKVLEESKPIDINPFYVTIYDGCKLEAFAPCYVDMADQYFYFGPYVIPFMKTVLDTSYRLHLSNNHVLLCYSPFCYRTKISLGENVNDRLVFNDLTEEIDAICKKNKILFSSFLFVSEFDKSLSTHLLNHGYRKFFFRKSFHLDVSWQNFEDYLQSLKRRVRNNVIREIRSCKERGVTIEEVSEFGSFSSILADLFSNLIFKYTKNPKSHFKPQFYESLSRYAKDKTVVFIAKKKGVMVGFSICLKQGKIMDAFHCGFNYDLLERLDFVYFNLAYYEPIKWAIREGIQKIYYRFTAEKVKLRRGCKPETLYSFVKCHNRLINSQIGNYLRVRQKLI